MKKIDYKKKLKHLYSASAKSVAIVDVLPMNFLLLNGQGDPNSSQAFQEGVEALFGVSYTLKFMIKRGEGGIDYGVMPLEGLWWTEDMSRFSIDVKDDWQWTLMIMQPEIVRLAHVDEAVTQVQKKKDTAALAKLRFESFTEGKAAQIMHIGPFSEEGPTIRKVHDHIKALGGTLSGKHHEIYLSDIRKAAPEKWKTIIRSPWAEAQDDGRRQAHGPQDNDSSGSRHNMCGSLPLYSSEGCPAAIRKGWHRYNIEQGID